MADRAVRQDVPEKGVFDLEKDERWQARLAEARARRAIALREKATSNEVPKRRHKPWEEEGQEAGEFFEPIEPLLQPEDDDRLDFSERVKSLREVVTKHGGNGGPPVDATYSVDTRRTSELLREPKAPFNDQAASEVPEPAAPKTPSIADRYISALAPDFKPVRPFVPGGDPGYYEAPPARAPETPPPAEEAEPLRRTKEAPEAAASVAPGKKPPRRRGVPALLLAGICLLALAPFTKVLPPVVKGPSVEGETAGFGLVPALGLLRPMNAIPRETVSFEWLPKPNLAAAGPLALPFERPAVFAREISPLRLPEPGAGAFGTLGWAGIAPVADRPRGLGLAVLRQDRLPGVAEAVPAVTEAAEADAAPVYPEPLSLLRVTILVPSSANSALAAAIAEDVAARGHAVAPVKPVDLKISERNIRYFHAEDRGEAARLAEAHDARLRDFTSFRPRPGEGTVEIWLAGEGVGAPVAPLPAVRAPVEVPVPQPRVVIVQRTPSLLGRISNAIGGYVGDGVSEPASDGGDPAAPDPVPTAGGVTNSTTGTANRSLSGN